MAATSVPDMAGLIKIGDDTFKSRKNPLHMGNAAQIAYGGCAQAFAVNASAATVDTEHYRLYSVLGNFLGPAKTDRPFEAKVTRVRSTNAFATRLVVVSQVLDDGTSRAVLSATADYQRIEPKSLMTYSLPRPELAGSLEDSISGEAADEFLASLPGSSSKLVKLFKQTFEPAFRFFEYRTVKTGISAQNLYGLLKKAETSQDHLTLTEKASFDWWRARAPLQTYADHASSLIYQLDGALAFIPLTHSHMFLQDAAACSSLDFALRLFENDLDLNKWHFRQSRTIVGGNGRTFVNALCWDESGKLIAEMSQQAIMRPHAERAARI